MKLTWTHVSLLCDIIFIFFIILFIGEVHVNVRRLKEVDVTAKFCSENNISYISGLQIKNQFRCLSNQSNSLNSKFLNLSELVEKPITPSVISKKPGFILSKIQGKCLFIFFFLCKMNFIIN